MATSTIENGIITFTLDIGEEQKVKVNMFAGDDPNCARDERVAPRWLFTSPTVVLVSPAADGLHAVYRALAPGSSHQSVTVDGDLSDGSRDVVGESNVIVLAPKLPEVTRVAIVADV